MKRCAQAFLTKNNTFSIPYLLIKYAESAANTISVQFNTDGKDWPLTLSRYISGEHQAHVLFCFFSTQTSQASCLKRQSRKLAPKILGGKAQYRMYRAEYLACEMARNLHTLLQAVESDTFNRNQQLQV